MIFKKKKSYARKTYDRYNENLEKCRQKKMPALLPPPMWGTMGGSVRGEAEEYAPMQRAMRRRYERYKNSLKR